MRGRSGGSRVGRRRGEEGASPGPSGSQLLFDHLVVGLLRCLPLCDCLLLGRVCRGRRDVPTQPCARSRAALGTFPCLHVWHSTPRPSRRRWALAVNVPSSCRSGCPCLQCVRGFILVLLLMAPVSTHFGSDLAFGCSAITSVVLPPTAGSALLATFVLPQIAGSADRFTLWPGLLLLDITHVVLPPKVPGTHTEWEDHRTGLAIDPGRRSVPPSPLRAPGRERSGLSSSGEQGLTRGPHRSWSRTLSHGSGIPRGHLWTAS